MPAEGDAAPDFTLFDQDDNQVKLSGLRGETVVLYFYPRADTPCYNYSSEETGGHRHHPSLGAQEAR
jgi:peroxiredoxin Q/BCP